MPLTSRETLLIRALREDAMRQDFTWSESKVKRGPGGKFSSKGEAKESEQAPAKLTKEQEEAKAAQEKRQAEIDADYFREKGRKRAKQEKIQGEVDANYYRQLGREAKAKEEAEVQDFVERGKAENEKRKKSQRSTRAKTRWGFPGSSRGDIEPILIQSLRADAYLCIEGRL